MRPDILSMWLVLGHTTFGIEIRRSTSSTSGQNDGWKNRYNRKWREFENERLVPTDLDLLIKKVCISLSSVIDQKRPLIGSTTLVLVSSFVSCFHILLLQRFNPWQIECMLVASLILFEVGSYVEIFERSFLKLTFTDLEFLPCPFWFKIITGGVCNNGLTFFLNVRHQ